MNLPPLPEPYFKLNWHDHAARYTVSKPNIGKNTDVFTADQMCERDLQIWNLARKQALSEPVILKMLEEAAAKGAALARKQALEEAAQLCDVNDYQDWEIRCGAEGREIYTDMAQAIRSLIK